MWSTQQSDYHRRMLCLTLTPSTFPAVTARMIAVTRKSKRMPPKWYNPVNCIPFRCSCWQMTIQQTSCDRDQQIDREVGYVHRRLPEIVLTGVYECNSNCKCNKTCLNRVVQHPMRSRLQVSASHLVWKFVHFYLVGFQNREERLGNKNTSWHSSRSFHLCLCW